MRFIKYNANPKNWKTGDCVFRAIAVATQQTWDQVYDDLYEIGKKKCRPMNDPIVYSYYLKQKGFTEEKQMKHSSGMKYDIHEVIESNPDSILLIHCAHHLTVAINGVLVDTWNCGYRVSGKYWKLPIEDEGEIIRFLQWLEENKMIERRRLL